MRNPMLAVIAAVMLAAAPAAAPAAGEVRLQWFGQAAFKVTTPGDKVIVIDPFITGNPVTPERHKDLDALGDIDLILLTHAHGDHVGDAPALARTSGAPVGVNADFGSTLRVLDVIPGNQLIRFNKSGPIRPLGDGITVTMVHAEHSSDFVHSAGGETEVHPGGEPVGYIIELENGYTIWHMGDTGVFGDMAWIAEYYQPDLVLAPIGGHFTMDPEHAAWAIDELIQPPTVMPIHYGTFPPLKGTPEQLEQALGDSPTELVVMQPGQTRTFD